MAPLDELSKRAGQEIERRRFLARLAAWGAGLGAALMTPGVLRAAGNSRATGGPRTAVPAYACGPSNCQGFCYSYNIC